MAFDPRSGEFVRELLEELGEIRVRPMFGAAGVYCGALMFGLIDDGTLYLRADADNLPALTEAGSRQFVYSTKDGERMSLSYWSLPDTAADDPQEAVGWASEAVAAAARKQAAGRRKGRRAKAD